MTQVKNSRTHQWARIAHEKNRIRLMMIKADPSWVVETILEADRIYEYFGAELAFKMVNKNFTSDKKFNNGDRKFFKQILRERRVKRIFGIKATYSNLAEKND